MSIQPLQAWASPRRILLATDLVDLKYTLPLAMQQAKAYSAELRIAHVLPDPYSSVIDPVLLVNADTERIRKNAQEEIEMAAAAVTHAGIRCSFHLVAGDVTNELLMLCKEWRAERMIAGSHGKEKFHLHILGSLAESLFHRIDIPILATGPHAPLEKNFANAAMRIVFATSLDQGAQYMAKFALSVAEEHGADITLLYVNPDMAQAHPSAARVADYASSMLNDLLSVQLLKKCKPSFKVLYGQPAKAIAEYATANSADMIILGASSHSAFDTRFIPGTAYRVLCEALCPVLVLKQD